MKERIIGAIVLVAVVVLVVPVFLDGPPTNGTVRGERVPLPGQDDSETQTIVLERDRSNPVPPQATPQVEPGAQPEAGPVDGKANDIAVPATQAVAQVTLPDDRKASSTKISNSTPDAAISKDAALPTRETAPSSKSATGMYAVQLGSFSNKQNAEKLAASLRKQGFAAFLSQLHTDSGELQRVRIGPQKDRQAAEAMAVRLKAAGHKGQVVPHP
ncbi:MAG TPA: SPOR domain-containing protein [Woeseiaceae bacterium]|nr:SPOR domain-containing protein [Woeseiaceae bacterium]